MRSYAYWLLLSVLEELKGNKKDIQQFGAKLGIKIAEELSYNELPQDSLVAFIRHILPTISKYMDSQIDCTEEKKEISIHVGKEDSDGMQEEKLEMLSGVLSAVVERVLNIKIKVKTYAPSSLLIIQNTL
ncbi:hypothetical protein NEMIN01_1214 [Nematocida minor]|uniref:uncharacterized protein n=1 Tax=Nematocida minor TaxID=1912983 RepID=UPI00221E6F32|nr:uncharacterized protein NEMIN01_1214 [Nematocida minor]KAI5190812.1 hypothetical protein NEMIN01_1214 [Nematocida minor]